MGLDYPKRPDGGDERGAPGLDLLARQTQRIGHEVRGSSRRDELDLAQVPERSRGGCTRAVMRWRP